MAVLSIMGLYNYDNTVLNGLINNLPSPGKVPVDSYPDLYYTPEPLDSDALIGELLLECAELEVLYPSVTTMSQAVNVWAITHKKVWQDYYNTMWYKYNPIWNKDGIITRTETEERNLQNNETRDLTREQTGDTTTTNNLTTTENNSQTTTPDTTEQTDRTHEVAGYNSNTLVTQSQDTQTVTLDGNTTVTQDNEMKNTGTVGQDVNLTDTDTGTIGRTDTGTITRTYEDKETGNIGITMTQQMIDAERETIQFNIYKMIIDDFKNRFCLLLY